MRFEIRFADNRNIFWKNDKRFSKKVKTILEKYNLEEVKEKNKYNEMEYSYFITLDSLKNIINLMNDFDENIIIFKEDDYYYKYNTIMIYNDYVEWKGK